MQLGYLGDGREIVLRSPLSVDEVLARLRQGIDELDPSPLFDTPTLRLRGEASRDSLRVWTTDSGRRRPLGVVLTGQVVPAASGSEIRGRLSQSRRVAWQALLLVTALAIFLVRVRFGAAPGQVLWNVSCLAVFFAIWFGGIWLPGRRSEGVLVGQFAELVEAERMSG